MKVITLCIMSALPLAARAFARIGETIKQIEDRYGQPSQTPGHFDRDELGNEFSLGTVACVTERTARIKQK